MNKKINLNVLNELVKKILDVPIEAMDESLAEIQDMQKILAAGDGLVCLVRSTQHFWL